MTTRKSYNQSHAEYLARIRAQNPELAALWDWPEDTKIGHADDPTDNPLPPEFWLREFGKVPISDAEKYGAAACLDARQCVRGRGED